MVFLSELQWDLRVVLSRWLSEAESLMLHFEGDVSRFIQKFPLADPRRRKMVALFAL